MAKFVCTVCGYVYEGENPPDECPVCHQPASKFKEESDTKNVLPEVEDGDKVQTDLSYDATWKKFTRWLLQEKR